MNIYADNTLLGFNSKDLNDRKLTAHHVFNLAQMAQCGKDWLVKLNMSNTETVTFHDYREDCEMLTIMMNGYSLKEAP